MRDPWGPGQTGMMTDPFAPVEPPTHRHYSADEIYNFIVTYKREHDGCSPAIREIQEALDIVSTSTVHHHLRQLEKKGFVRLDEDKSRSIQIVGGHWSLEGR